LFKNIIIIAEGIPERETREIIALNKQYNLNIVGPATVGAMEAGVFRAGNTG
jgi:ATP citrate (pro-S)-lyase